MCADCYNEDPQQFYLDELKELLKVDDFQHISNDHIEALKAEIRSTL